MFSCHSEKLRDAWPRMTEQERVYVGEMHADFEQQFKASKGAQPEGIAAGLHLACDEHIAHLMTLPRADEVQCRKGCSHCCRLNVDVTLEEAQLLLYAANEAGVRPDPLLMARQAQAPAWADLAPADRACVFLGPDDACTVYEHRPLMCRKLFALSPAEDCDSIARPGEKVLNFVSITAEVLTSASLAVFEVGPMPRMLARASIVNLSRSDME